MYQHSQLLEMTILPDTSIDQEFPRKGTWFYNIIHQEKSGIPRSIKWFRRANNFIVIPLYRLRILPTIGIGRLFLLLTTIGRKSGKKRRTPLEFHRLDGVIHIASSRGENADWVKNIKKNPDKVTIQVGFRSYPIKIEFLKLGEKIEFFRWYTEHLPRAAKTGYGWNPKTDQLETADFSILAQHMSIIRLHQ